MQTTSSKNGGFGLALLVTFALTFQPGAAIAAGATAKPVIQHDPVTYAVKGQSLTMKAKVTDDKGPGVQDVTLYYALFRDAAPFRVPMKASGLDFYLGTIDAAMVKDVGTIAYYIEAQDKDGVSAETPWYTVEFRKADETPAVIGNGGNGADTSGADHGMSWKTVGLIGAGAIAVVGGAIALSGGGGSSSGGGGGSGGTNTPSVVGTYNGAVTTCVTLNGQQPSCESHNCTIVIGANGVLFSDTLLPNSQLTGNISGNNFILTGQAVNQGGISSGLINYDGTVINGQIAGSITGNATTSNGVVGNFSGSFSASRPH